MAMKLEGMQSLLREVERMGKQVNNQLEEEALTNAADYLIKEAKENVYSHGLEKRSGDAEKAVIKSEVKNGKIEVGVTNSGEGFYMYFHEFGYYNKRAKTKVEARPWFQPTYETVKGKLPDKMAEVIKQRFNL